MFLSQRIVFGRKVFLCQFRTDDRHLRQGIVFFIGVEAALRTLLPGINIDEVFGRAETAWLFLISFL